MLRILFYAIIVILVLSFFGVSIEGIVHSPAGQANFGYIDTLFASAYHFIQNLYWTTIEWVAGMTS